MTRLVLPGGLFLVLSSASVSAQDLLWSTSIGGTEADGAYSAVEAHDGGFVVAGFIEVPGYPSDAYVVCTDEAGNVRWSVTRGGLVDDVASAVARTSDGGYVVTGRLVQPNGNSDFHLLRLDGDGNTVWERTFDFSDAEGGNDVCETEDGGFAVVGGAWFGSSTFGSSDVVLFKTDAFGNLDWMRTYAHESSGFDMGLGVEETSDNGFIVAGTTQSSIWAGYVIRTDAIGQALWQRVYPDTWQCDDVRLTSDGGFAMTGVARPPGGGLETGSLLLRTDAVGEPLWQKSYGNGYGQSLRELACGGFVIAGHDSSSNGTWDVYVVRTDEAGEEVWSRSFGTEGDDRGFGVVSTSAERIFVVGWVWSLANDLDLYLLELDDLCAHSTSYCFGDGRGTSCPCLNNGNIGRGCANSATADGALLTPQGIPSVSANELWLIGAGLTPDQPGVYFQGVDAIAGGDGTAFGDGLRCAGGNVRRLQTVIADSSGNSTTAADIAARGGVTPGDVRRYQLWYRDPIGSMCGFGFNLTNGVEIQWAP